MDCVFCNIVSGEVKENILLETKSCIVIFDANPVTTGHTLVVLKSHYATITEAPKDVAMELFETVLTVATRIVESTSARGLGIYQNNGKISDEHIPHVHVHIVPRYEDEELVVTVQKRRPSAKSGRRLEAITVALQSLSDSK